jgi:Domain of unknown function (DUF4398)
MPRLRRAARGLVCASLLLVSACSEPPTKEMNQAQGAIDTARAAGADRYAPEEFKAATAALDKSREMATQRDYRQALNFALDARERAHEAARSGAERMAQVRGEAETELQSATLLLQTARSRAKIASGRAPAPAQTALHETLAQAEKTLQEARAAITRQEYQQARDQTRAAAERIREALTELDGGDRRTPARKPAAR